MNEAGSPPLDPGHTGETGEPDTSGRPGKPRGSVIRVALTRLVAVQYGPRGVRANCICPGAVDTPMTGGVWDSVGEGVSVADGEAVGDGVALADSVGDGVSVGDGDSVVTVTRAGDELVFTVDGPAVIEAAQAFPIP